MDLIVWRHAEAQEAQEGQDDLARALTSKGEKQALRVGGWLDRTLPDAARVLSSPARRCEQTALALGRKYKVRMELQPGSTVAQILEAAHWPVARQPVVIVGHQPELGDVLAHLLGMNRNCPIRKGAAWWLRTRERAGDRQTSVVAVQPPDLA